MEFNPEYIPEEDCPLIVLSDKTTDFISWAIKWRTKASYNHVMILLDKDTLVTQSYLYGKLPLSKYLEKNCRLKFWKMKINKQEKDEILNNINKDLQKPWWQRAYDYVGIFGQATGLTFISTPGLDYCSEKVADTIRGIFPYISSHPSPEDLNETFKAHPEHFEVYGRWEKD